MANIKDVAQKANLSVATVSRYLNQNGYVSQKSKDKIIEAIEALNYKPNTIARSLSKQQSNIIGLIVPDIKNPYFPELARAVEDTALKYNYTVVLCNSDENADKEKLYIERLTQKYVAGLIVTTCLLEPSFYENIDTPIVALDRKISDGISSVTTNNIAGAELAAKYLMKNDVQNLLFLRGPAGLQTADDRLKGFQRAVANSSINTYVAEASFDFQTAAVEVVHALKQYPNIDSIFASSDVAAIAALKVVQEQGKRVPEDIQIVGFDGIALGEMVSPALTTIGQNLYKMGEKATSTLIQQIEQQHIRCTHKIIDAELIVRATTKGENYR